MKNLVKVETRTKKRAAGATTKADIKGKLVEYAWKLKNRGYAETTITTRTVILKVLVKRGANLYDPESVKETIANQNWSDGRKMNAVYAYDQFLKLIGRTWEPPIYVATRTIPFIPTEAEIDALIAGCGKKMATKLQLIKETAMRSGEAKRLKWTDVDTKNRVIRLNAPEKNSNPRIFKVSQRLIAMLNSLPKTSLRVFRETASMTDNKNLYCQRKRLAKKLDNPRLLQISFHTLRHWKATMLYHQTKDILYVKEFLGHKNINSTLMYIQIAKVVFGASANDEFICKVAETPEEVSELIEAGFNYVTDLEGKKFFRKRK
jgi:integrase